MKPKFTKALWQAIQDAPTRAELERLHDELTAAWDRDQVDRDTAEALTRLMWEKDRQIPEHHEGADELRLSGLFKDNPIRRVYSRILDEEVLFAADDAELPADNALVVYRESELRALAGHPPAAVLQIHLAKAVFDGEVI